MGVGEALTESVIDGVSVFVGVAVGVPEVLAVFDGLKPKLIVAEGDDALVVEGVGLGVALGVGEAEGVDVDDFVSTENVSVSDGVFDVVGVCELVCEGVGVFEVVDDAVLAGLTRALAEVDVLPVTLLDVRALGESEGDALKLVVRVVIPEALLVALTPLLADAREEKELHALAKAERLPAPFPALALTLIVAEDIAVPRALTDVELLRLTAKVCETVAVKIALTDFEDDSHVVVDAEGVPEAVELGDAVSFDEPVA
jgi:hypothetical protein